MVAKNPIEQRLDKIGEYWDEFWSDPEARILRWLANRDDRQLIETFIDLQNEEAGETPELFIRLTTPFTHHNQYSLELIKELKRQYTEIQPNLAEEEIPNHWVGPEPQVHEAAIATWVRCCHSFQAYYRELFANLAIVLAPTQLSSPTAWQDWLLSLLNCNPPTKVRFVIFDSLEQPVLEPLCESAPQKIRTINPDLDIPGAMEEIAQNSGDPNDPGTQFRQHFVAMSNAASKSDLDRMTHCANAALQIAQQQNWPQMQFAVYMSNGATFLAANQIDSALSSYRQAHRIIETSDDPTKPKLLIQSYLAEGAALLSKNLFSEAATVYYQAGLLADEHQEAFMALESWRMAAYCHEVEKQPAPAWQYGQNALNAGGQLDEDNRAHSTLPYAGQGLFRIAKKYGPPYSIDEVNHRMERLIGAPAWQQALREGGLTS